MVASTGSSGALAAVRCLRRCPASPSRGLPARRGWRDWPAALRAGRYCRRRAGCAAPGRRPARWLRASGTSSVTSSTSSCGRVAAPPCAAAAEGEAQDHDGVQQRGQQQHRHQPLAHRRAALTQRQRPRVPRLSCDRGRHGEQYSRGGECSRASSSYSACARSRSIEHACADVELELLVELAHAGGAGDIDLGDVAADHVQAHEQHAGRAQRRADLPAQPAVALVERPADALGAGGEIAAIVVGRPGCAPARRAPARRRSAARASRRRRRCRAGTSARSRSAVP